MLGLGGAGAADCAAQICAAQEAARRTVAKVRFLRLGEPMKDVTTLFLRLFCDLSVYRSGSRFFGLRCVLIVSHQAAPCGMGASNKGQVQEVVMPDGFARDWLY